MEKKRENVKKDQDQDQVWRREGGRRTGCVRDADEGWHERD